MVPALPRISRRGTGISVSLAFLKILLLVSSVRGQDASGFQPPQPPPVERYAAIWERAPFQLKTVATGPVNTQSFAENLALAGLSDSNGVITVYLKDKTTGEYVELTSQKPTDSGMEFDKIVESDDPRQVKVSLRKGSETAEVGYALEQMTPAAGPGPGPAGGVLGGRPSAPIAPVPAPLTNPDPAANQQKNRRRIILPQSAPPQAFLVDPSSRSFATLAAVGIPFSQTSP